MKNLTGRVLLVLAVCGTAFGAYAPKNTYPPAAEDPVMDGEFTTFKECRNANMMDDDLHVGILYYQNRENWTVNGIEYPKLTLFCTHYFYDSGYGQLDTYDLNSWEITFKRHKIQLWVFLEGEHPDVNDWKWLDTVEIGADNYPDGIYDDGGFLVRLDDDPNTDRQWFPGDPEPGDPNWDPNDFYGAFGKGGFNNSAYTKYYSFESQPREIYEFSLTLNDDPAASDDPLVDPVLGKCEHWVKITINVKVKDWKPSMGGQGVIGGPGIVPMDFWVIMGGEWLHPADDDGMWVWDAVLTCMVTGGSGRNMGGLASVAPSPYVMDNPNGYVREHLNFGDANDDITFANGQMEHFWVARNAQRYAISWMGAGREVMADFTMTDQLKLAHFNCPGYSGDYTVDFCCKNWTDPNNYQLPTLEQTMYLDSDGHINTGEYNWITFYEGSEIIRDPNGEPVNETLPYGTEVRSVTEYEVILHESGLKPDLNGDFKVDFFDIAILADKWLSTL